MAWDTICLQKVCGGWNIKDMVIWNRVVVAKHFWAISQKQDILWFRWPHAYYIKRQQMATMPILQRLSWPMKKILNSKDCFQEFNAQRILEREVFSIKKLYKCMQGEHDKVNWRRIICNNSASPKAIFITWLTLHDKLTNKSRLYSWGIAPEKQCVHCENADETRSHLFFNCPTADTAWKICLQQNRATLP